MTRRGFILPLVILAIGVLVRILFVLQVRDLPFYYHPVMDSGFFHQWANFKVDATWVDLALPFRESGYAFFMAALYAVFGESYTAVRLVQAVLGGVTALLVYAIGSMLFGRLAGAIAGVILALSSLAVFFTGELNETALVVFLIVLSLYLLIRGRKHHAHLNSAVSGVLLGFAFLARFTAIVALPAYLIDMLTHNGSGRRFPAVLLIAGFVAVPLVYHTLLLETGEFALLPTRAGWQAFLGSNSTGGKAREMEYVISMEDGASRAYAKAGLTDGEHDAIRLARIEGGEPVGRQGTGRYWQGRAFDDFFAAPSSYLAHYSEKLGIIWGPSVPGANLDSRYMARYSFLLRNPLFPFTGLVGLGLMGLVLFAWRRSSSMPIFLVSYSLLAGVYLVSDADKMLLIPFLAVFGGQLLAAIYAGFRRLRPVRSVIYLAGAVLLSVLFSALPSVPVNEARHLMILGDIYQKESLFDKSEEALSAAIEVSPDYNDARLSLGRLYATTGKPDKALATLTQAIERDPNDPRLRIERASLLIYIQRPEEALSDLNAAGQSYPYEPRLHQSKGLALIGMNELEAAARELEMELEYVGGDFVTYSALGRARFGLGQYEEAAEVFEIALRSNPYSSAPTAMQLADCYTMLERHEDAVEVLARIANADPGNVRLRFKLGNALYRAGRYDESLENFKEISKFDPRNVDILLNMGVVYAELDSLGRAVEVWERVLQIDPGNDTALDNIRRARE